MVRTGSHVVWCCTSGGRACGSDAFLVSLGSCVAFSSCRFGTSWCVAIRLYSTFNGILGLGFLCKGQCGQPPLDSLSSNVLKCDGPTRSIWPQCADAMAECFDGIRGTSVAPKCVHLAGFMAPAADDSMLVCLEQIGFKPSGGRAISTVASRVAACIQPTRRLAPTILPEGLGTEAHLAVALQTQHPFSSMRSCRNLGPVC